MTVEPDIRKRRRVLYIATGLAILLVAVFAARSLLSGDERPEPAAKVLTPVIIERIQLKPVRSEKARGLVEILRRGEAESLRVLVARLKPSTEKQVYQLIMAGGASDEKVLGNQVVGEEGIFVGESKVSVATLNKYKRIEMRLITNGAPPSVKLVLRGAIPR